MRTAFCAALLTALLAGCARADARAAGTWHPEAAAARAQLRDGGWSLDTLDRTSGSTLRRFTAHSDGYATGLATLALLRTAPDDDHAARGLAWLRDHQDPADGFWTAHSLNTDSPSADSALFMNDAATAFTVLALAESGSQVR
jgi:hypothetical protein